MWKSDWNVLVRQSLGDGVEPIAVFVLPPMGEEASSATLSCYGTIADSSHSLEPAERQDRRR